MDRGSFLPVHFYMQSNVPFAADLTKGGTFKGDKNKASAIDWI
jgi:hypothetical protein